MEELIKLQKKHDELRVQLDKKMKTCPDGLSYDEWVDFMDPEQTQLEVLSQKIRLLIEPEFEDLDPTSGDVMSLEQFVESVKCGDFIDYDGHGCYVRGDKESNIVIFPSDVIAGRVRKDFDTIIWFNK